MANVAAIKALIRTSSDEWITQKIEDLRDEVSSGREFTSISEAGKSHSEEANLPLDLVIEAVMDVAFERGLAGANNKRKARATFVTFG
jgi:hypothetical protein